MDVLRCHVFQIHLINLTADLHIARHLWRCNDIVDSQGRVGKQLHIMAGTSLQLSAGGVACAQTVCLLYLLHHFKQPRPSGNPIGLQGRTDRQTNGLFRAAGICNHQIGGHGIEPALHTLHRSVKRLQINGDITFFHPADTTFHAHYSKHLFGCKAPYFSIFTAKNRRYTPVLPHYSYRSASMGSSFAALLAG